MKLSSLFSALTVAPLALLLAVPGRAEDVLLRENFSEGGFVEAAEGAGIKDVNGWHSTLNLARWVPEMGLSVANPRAGGTALGGGGGVKIASAGNAVLDRAFDAPSGAPEIWMRMLIRFNPECVGGERIRIGFHGDGGKGAEDNNLRAQLQFNSPFNQVRIGDKVSPNTHTVKDAGWIYLLVLRVSKGADATRGDDYDRMDFWIDPGFAALGEPANVSITAPSGYTRLDGLNVVVHNLTETDGKEIHLDDILIAESLDTLFPNP